MKYAVKSATNNELQGEDLLSKESQVKWIITKSALRKDGIAHSPTC